ncbi:MAG: alkaline phosphatase [bacterium]
MKSLLVIFLTIALILNILVFSSVKVFSDASNKSVILVIGDGMGLPIISAYEYYKSEHLKKGYSNFAEFDGAFLVRTRSKDYVVTDSAAGATAFAIGRRVPNYQVGELQEGKRIPTIMDIAKSKGKSTGIVVECSITHATPAAFYSYSASRKDDANIAKQLLYSNLDLVISGGYKHFVEHQDKLKSLGYTVLYGEEELRELIQTNKITEKLIVFTAYDHPPQYKQRKIKLEKKVEYALENLSRNPKGFFLLVEASQIDWYAHQNKIIEEIDEMEDLDYALRIILNYAKNNQNTLVLVLADHDCGGLSLVDYQAKIFTPEFKVKYSSDYHVADHIVAFYKGYLKPKPIVDNTEVYYMLLDYLK